MDSVTGDLSDTRTRYLGTKGIKLFRVKCQNNDAVSVLLILHILIFNRDCFLKVLAMSSRTWLLYYYQSRFHLTPLSYEPLEYASSFASEQCPEGIVAIAANTLRILALEKLGHVFNQVATPCKYTPRKFVIHHESGNIIMTETDHNTYTEQVKQMRKKQMAEVNFRLIDLIFTYCI